MIFIVAVPELISLFEFSTVTVSSTDPACAEPLFPERPPALAAMTNGLA
jgi:hypothetical protein